ncbi:hypothetical protein Pelo_11193 [Pelomyxa schiedti]|nr:hypothetical protein Pelo_11193 [Pelomyxa schiedti]
MRPPPHKLPPVNNPLGLPPDSPPAPSPSPSPAVDAKREARLVRREPRPAGGQDPLAVREVRGEGAGVGSAARVGGAPGAAGAVAAEGPAVPAAAGEEQLAAGAVPAPAGEAAAVDVAVGVGEGAEAVALALGVDRADVRGPVGVGHGDFARPIISSPTSPGSPWPSSGAVACALPRFAPLQPFLCPALAGALRLCLWVIRLVLRRKSAPSPQPQVGSAPHPDTSSSTIPTPAVTKPEVTESRSETNNPAPVTANATATATGTATTTTTTTTTTSSSSTGSTAALRRVNKSRRRDGVTRTRIDQPQQHRSGELVDDTEEWWEYDATWSGAGFRPAHRPVAVDTIDVDNGAPCPAVFVPAAPQPRRSLTHMPGQAKKPGAEAEAVGEAYFDDEFADKLGADGAAEGTDEGEAARRDTTGASNTVSCGVSEKTAAAPLTAAPICEREVAGIQPVSAPSEGTTTCAITENITSPSDAPAHSVLKVHKKQKKAHHQKTTAAEDVEVVLPHKQVMESSENIPPDTNSPLPKKPKIAQPLVHDDKEHSSSPSHPIEGQEYCAPGSIAVIPPCTVKVDHEPLAKPILTNSDVLNTPTESHELTHESSTTLPPTQIVENTPTKELQEKFAAANDEKPTETNDYQHLPEQKEEALFKQPCTLEQEHTLHTDCSLNQALETVKPLAEQQPSMKEISPVDQLLEPHSDANLTSELEAEKPECTPIPRETKLESVESLQEVNLVLLGNEDLKLGSDLNSALSTAQKPEPEPERAVGDKLTEITESAVKSQTQEPLQVLEPETTFKLEPEVIEQKNETPGEFVQKTDQECVNQDSVQQPGQEGPPPEPAEDEFVESDFKPVSEPEIKLEDTLEEERKPVPELTCDLTPTTPEPEIQFKPETPLDSLNPKQEPVFDPVADNKQKQEIISETVPVPVPVLEPETEPVPVPAPNPVGELVPESQPSSEETAILEAEKNIGATQIASHETESAQVHEPPNADFDPTQETLHELGAEPPRNSEEEQGFSDSREKRLCEPIADVLHQPSTSSEDITVSPNHQEPKEENPVETKLERNVEVVPNVPEVLPLELNIPPEIQLKDTETNELIAPEPETKSATQVGENSPVDMADRYTEPKEQKLDSQDTDDLSPAPQQTIEGGTMEPEPHSTELGSDSAQGSACIVEGQTTPTEIREHSPESGASPQPTPEQVQPELGNLDEVDRRRSEDEPEVPPEPVKVLTPDKEVALQTEQKPKEELPNQLVDFAGEKPLELTPVGEIEQATETELKPTEEAQPNLQSQQVPELHSEPLAEVLPPLQPAEDPTLLHQEAETISISPQTPESPVSSLESQSVNPPDIEKEQPAPNTAAPNEVVEAKSISEETHEHEELEVNMEVNQKLQTEPEITIAPSELELKSLPSQTEQLGPNVDPVPISDQKIEPEAEQVPTKEEVPKAEDMPEQESVPAPEVEQNLIPEKDNTPVESPKVPVITNPSSGIEPTESQQASEPLSLTGELPSPPQSVSKPMPGKLKLPVGLDPTKMIPGMVPPMQQLKKETQSTSSPSAEGDTQPPPAKPMPGKLKLPLGLDPTKMRPGMAPPMRQLKKETQPAPPSAPEDEPQQQEPVAKPAPGKLQIKLNLDPTRMLPGSRSPSLSQIKKAKATSAAAEPPQPPAEDAETDSHITDTVDSPPQHSTSVPNDSKPTMATRPKGPANRRPPTNRHHS